MEIKTHLPNPLLGPKVRAPVTELIDLTVCSDEVLGNTMTFDVHGSETLVQVAIAFCQIIQVT